MSWGNGSSFGIVDELHVMKTFLAIEFVNYSHYRDCTNICLYCYVLAITGYFLQSEVANGLSDTGFGGFAESEIGNGFGDMMVVREIF